MVQLVMLGTGHAMVTKCYNTCFVIKTDHGSFLVDGGGGNTILSNMDKAGVDWKELQALFITHSHTDHIVGCIWVMRKINTLMNKGKFFGKFNVYGLERDLEFLKNACDYMIYGGLNEKIVFIPVKGDCLFRECGISFQAIDVPSTKKAQLGFKAEISNGDDRISLVCLGDERVDPQCEKYAENADWMMLESFCLLKDEPKFQAYEKHHSTVADAAKLAGRLNVGNIILYHAEDTDLENRSVKFREEAGKYYGGNIFVPNDLDEIKIQD